MIRLLFFISLLTVYIASPGQVPQKQTNQAELIQEIKDLKNDIKELEAEIIEVEKEDPEEAKALKKELASLKKMLAMLEKSTSSVPAKQMTAAKSPTVAKYQSPIEPIFLNQPVTTPTEAQAKDRLLWYRGKKVNDSTLVTVAGMVVQHHKKKDKVILQPDKKKDPFEKMIQELSMSDKRKEELFDKFSKMKNGFLYFPDIEKTVILYNEMTTEYNELVKNTIELPPIQDEGKTEEIIKNKKEEKPENDHPIIESWKKTIAEAKRKLNALPALGNFPAPPEKDLTNCSWCDSIIRKREKIEDSIWSKKFFGQENEIFVMVFSVLHQAAILGGEDFGAKNNTDHIVDSLLKRMKKKTKLLWERYGKDIKRFEIVMRAVLSFERQKVLLGGDEEPEVIPISSMVDNMDSIYLAYFKEQVELKNHNYVLNFSKHLQFERMKALLGSSQKEIGEVFEMALKYNRFGLTLDLDFIYEQRDDNNELELKATGKIATTTKTFVMLKPEGCSYKAVLREADYSNITEDKSAIPMTVESGEKTLKNEEDKLVTYTYSGPPELKMQFPEFKINFCESKFSDTVFFMPLNYALGYQIPKSNLNKSYKDEMLPLANHMLIDMNSMEGKTAQGMELAAEIMAGLEEPDDSPSTGYPNLDKLKVKYNLKIRQDNYKKKLSEMAMNEKSVLLFHANDKSAILADKFKDTKYTIDENRKLIKGLIHFKLEHFPVY